MLLLSTQYPFSYESQIKSLGTHVDVDIFVVVFVCGTRAQNLSASSQLHPVHKT
jgi:hypothetical protein